MDPNATLKRFVDACEDNDREAARESLDDLREWIAKQGFLPDIAREWARRWEEHLAYHFDQQPAFRALFPDSAE